ncbi:putative Glutamate--tRNA ligase [Rhodotorula taiwanensis]|uniref:Glutamate--tRNA ligase, mitochondrial n=1 Tax=Rhodotorula taiwanensis TaxID=741276 RepID=A0A2S5B6A5_9BASI|nr:putative Glutamate--tRNA ligase [Rhodotorula taiwanensis]
MLRIATPSSPWCLSSPFARVSLARAPLVASSRRRCCSSKSPAAAEPRPPKLRFAPSPTGYLHLGGLRTALYNHLLARKLGGKWVLRIEDTDQTRYVPGAVEALLRTLRWAKLDYDEGPEKGGPNEPYFQSQRREVYDRYLQPLIENGHAYHCFCTPERLAETRKRLQREGSHEGYDRRCLGLDKKESSNNALTQEDMIYDPIHYESLPLEDFVLRKSDGLPTYHFANVVDDYEMGITHVLRGEEWLPSTPKHLQLYDALNLPRPQFAHLPLLVNPDGSKLSKRAGDVRVEDYISRGYEPEALLNFVALMGWSPQSSGSDTPSSAAAEPASSSPSDVAHEEVLPLAALIEAFSLEGVNKNRATMQAAKLDFLNRAHLRIKLADMTEGGGRHDVATRARKVIIEKWPQLEEQRPEVVSETYIANVAEALKDRMHTILDIPSLGPYFFQPPELDAAMSQKLYKSVPADTYRQSLEKAVDALSSLPDSAFSDSSAIESPPAGTPVRDKLDELVLARPGGKKAAKEVMTPLRHALTGQKARLPSVLYLAQRDADSRIE